MKIKVLQEDFSKALITTSRFTSSKVQLPVLANVLLNAYKNKLTISATNLETSISFSIGAKVEEEGELTIPAKTITEIVSNLGKNQVDLVTDKENLKIISGKFESLVTGMNSSDFPKVPQKGDKQSIKINAPIFSEALSKVLFSVSVDETRPVLTGVLTIIKKGGLSLVATDGFRLSQKSLKVESFGDEKKIILPKSILGELARIVEDEFSFSFKKEESQVIFESTNIVLASRIIDGEFPPYEKILPKEGKIKIFVDKEDFLRAVKLASVFAKDAANVVKLNIHNDGVTFLAESSQSGNETEEIEAKVIGETGKEGFLVAFNYRFLEDFLNAVVGDEVVAEFSDANAPVLFLDPKDKDFLHVIMPIRLQS